jgi:response regulator RpfG family c-di-GMP phosphodiesterase
MGNSEEIEILEEIHDDDEAEQIEALGARPEQGAEFATETGESVFKLLTKSYSQLPVPIAILNEELTILFKNEAFEAIVKRFHYPDRTQFPALFYSNLKRDEVADMYAALSSPNRRFYWKGKIQHKIKNTSTELTNVYIYPFFLCDPASAKPSGYTVFLDDVTAENQRLLRSLFLSLLEASKLKDNDTGEHIERVNRYSVEIAQELFSSDAYPEVDRDFIDDIGFLAAMHDVGKIGTPDDILNKAGPLTPWEWSIMREHTKNGAYILSTYPNPMAKQIALSHHEMWDGNGYPYKLHGEMIPLAARIVSIADVYDALRMKRSYKPAYSHAVAVEKILEWKGTHFDPALVAVFERIHPRFEKIFEENTD